MAPPKAVAPINTGSNPKRLVLERGKDSAANAKRCTSLSLPSGAGGGVFKGQSIAIVSVVVTISVSGMSRYLRISKVYCSQSLKAISIYDQNDYCQNKKHSNQLFAGDYKIKI